MKVLDESIHSLRTIMVLSSPNCPKFRVLDFLLGIWVILKFDLNKTVLEFLVSSSISFLLLSSKCIFL